MRLAPSHPRSIQVGPADVFQKALLERDFGCGRNIYEVNLRPTEMIESYRREC